MNTEIYETILSSDTVPEFARVSFDIERSRMDDLSAEIDRTLEQRGVLQRIRPGDRIALTASSRRSSNLKWILRRLCERVKQHGDIRSLFRRWAAMAAQQQLDKKRSLKATVSQRK